MDNIKSYKISFSVKILTVLLLSVFIFVPFVQAEFIDNGDGTVTDTETGLMWQQSDSDDEMPWDEALSYCEDLSLAGYSDWRLPNRNELQSIVDYDSYNPAINTDYFPSTQSSSYWSSSSYASYTGGAWLVHFRSGYVLYDSNKSLDDYVRAVRSGQVGNLVFDDLVISPSSGIYPLEVTLSASVSGGESPYSYYFDFGDGDTIDTSSSEVTHTYTEAGTFEVSCRVTDDEGNTVSKSGTVTVEEPPCEFTIKPPSKNFFASGGIQGVSIDASGDDCAWSVSEDLDWVSVSPTSGTGDGSVNVNVEENTSSSSRSGTITIAGKVFSVNQEAASEDQSAAVGLFDNTTSKFWLRSNEGSSKTKRFGSAEHAKNGDYQALVGDWDGDGDSEPGLFEKNTSQFWLLADDGSMLNFRFGNPDKAYNYQALVGDWNGNGKDDVGIFDEITSKFWLRGFPETGDVLSFKFGNPDQTDDYQVISGDWDGNEIDDVGIFVETSARFWLRDNSDGSVYETVRYGSSFRGHEYQAIAGDWDQDKECEIGLFDENSSTFWQRNDDGTSQKIRYGSAAKAQEGNYQALIGVW